MIDLLYQYEIANEGLLMNTEKLLTYRDLCTMFDRNYKTIWAWTKKGIFPAPVKLMGRTVGWKRADVEKWIEENS
ncbi:hypothetical protein VAE308_940001 [Vibrio aestuarianus]|uniref:Helix-turn-helix domain-containing protein n=2 Tax=Vibrio aestuarianus TaxID=28171 RepID=A0ABM9FMA5_9VIBR|nr:hypothetical protein VAE063_740002 [Vibrio aestuarianus]CAH8235247.1 hypothetical protein VAE308_940001 [Vibrio aestuarianus]